MTYKEEIYKACEFTNVNDPNNVLDPKESLDDMAILENGLDQRKKRLYMSELNDCIFKEKSDLSEIDMLLKYALAPAHIRWQALNAVMESEVKGE